VDFYFRVLDKLLCLMEDIEDSVFKENAETAAEVGALRHDIITRRRVMFPNLPLLSEMGKRVKRFSKTDLTIYFNDLMEHMNKICDTLDEYNVTFLPYISNHLYASSGERPPAEVPSLPSTWSVENDNISCVSRASADSGFWRMGLFIMAYLILS
jgi:hypothetical protein